MKEFYKYFKASVLFITFNIFLLNELASAGINPTFNLTVRNILRHPGGSGQDSIITFELYMQQTNQGQPDVYDFEYCAAQFVFSYNKLIHKPGGNLIFGLVPGGSDLPPELRPPSFQVDSVNGYLKTSGNLPSSLTNYFISGSYPGTKILTFKLRTNMIAFNPAPLNLKFKLGTTPNTLMAFFLPYPPTVDSLNFPNQAAVILSDTIVNHYYVEDTSGILQTYLISPEYNSSTNLRYIDFSWKSSINAKSYKLQISTDINFSSIVFNDSVLADTFATVSTLSPDLTYYWKVSGRNDSMYFTYSDIWIFRTGSVQAVLDYPPDSASYVPLPITFSWHSAGTAASPGPVILASEKSDNIFLKENFNSGTLMTEVNTGSGVRYRLDIANDPDFTGIIYTDSTITDTFRIVNNIVSNAAYYWKVTPILDSVFTSSSGVRSFNTYPAPLILSSPGNNANNVPFNVKCIWYKNSQALTYRLQVASDQNFSNIIFNDSAITDSFKTIGSLIPDTRYYWKVSAKNDSEYFSFSPQWSFTTMGILISPVNNSFNNPVNTNFKWHKADSAVNYVLQVSTDPSLSNLIINDSTLTDTFKTITGLINSTTYYWRIKVKYLSGNIFLSNTWNFTTTGGGLIIIFGTQLSGFSVVPPNSSQGIGAVTGTYNLSTKILNFDLIFAGLLGTTTSAHFHGPASSGFNAPVQIEFGGFQTGITSGHYANSYVLTSEQESQFMDGLWYVDIHTTVFPGGEIRGQFNEGPLPVELSAFTSNILKDKVTLNWSTSIEINNAGFDIERSSAESEWIKTGSVAGNGSTISIKNYSFSERLNSGKYNYRIKQTDFNGNFTYFNLTDEVEVGMPNKYSLSQNYPNPFNPVTKIDFELPDDGKISLVVYDISGRVVSTLINEFKTAGYHTVDFTASNLASGIYFYMIGAGDFQMTRKMMILK
ncbi:MAG: CHRD domain-containing protein [Ignavibacteria bacterium]|nr:CHRD domain-containing protein [Ignavibacteria bacterium]